MLSLSIKSGEKRNKPKFNLKQQIKMIYHRNGNRLYCYECNSSFVIANICKMNGHPCESIWRDYTRQAGSFRCNKCPSSWRFSARTVKRIMTCHTMPTNPFCHNTSSRTVVAFGRPSGCQRKPNEEKEKRLRSS